MGGPGAMRSRSPPRGGRGGFMGGGGGMMGGGYGGGGGFGGYGGGPPMRKVRDVMLVLARLFPPPPPTCLAAFVSPYFFLQHPSFFLPFKIFPSPSSFNVTTIVTIPFLCRLFLILSFGSS